jgi:hypothetical protein
MLDAWIIEKLKREKEQRRREESRPGISIELPEPLQPAPKPPEKPQRGIVIIQMWG